MALTEKDYHNDNGYLSRKFLLALIGIVLISTIGISYSIFGWGVGIFETIASSIVTIALGYIGISVARVAIPRTALKLKGNIGDTTSDQESDKAIDKGEGV
jgi:hypothetical protein